MAYDYDADILAALWTGAEDGEEPYATILAENPDLTDDTEEVRILSTIELLRSHMELIRSRSEAKVLHEAIARLIRHTAGGSNPFSDSASITTAIGNVKQPTFPAGATLSITNLNTGESDTPASATGGDLDTVIGELNVALATSDPRVEITELTIPNDSPDGSLSGKYFTINSADDATSYYVWFDNPGRAEVSEVITTGAGDLDGNRGGTYFELSSAGDATRYYVWMSHSGRAESMSLDFTGVTGATLPTGAVPAAYFDIDSTSTAYRLWFDDTSTTPPAAGGRTLVAVSFTGGDSDVTIAGSVASALTGADADFAGFSNGGTAIVTGTLATAGSVPDPVDGAVATGAVLTTTTQGIDAATDPAPGGGLAALPVSYTVNDSASELASALRSDIGANADFDTEGAGDTVTISNASVGIATDAADVSTEFSVSTTTQGVDAAVDPAPGGLTGITVSYTLGDTGSENIDAAVSSAIGALADFSAESGTFSPGGTLGSVTVTNAATGGATDAADVNSGVLVNVTQQGTDGLSGVGIEAFKTADGRLGFRATDAFTNFTISNGGGGIVGPAGVIPGSRESTPRRVANEGRDAATNSVVGNLQRNPL